MKGGLRSSVEASRDKGWLKTLNSSLESDNSTIPSPSSFSFFFSLMVGWEEEAPTLGIPSNIGVVVKTPSRMGPVARKLGAVTLIYCR